MGIVLKVTPDVLTQMASDIEKQISDIQTQFDEIDTEINKTRGYWEGEASDEHLSRYEKMKDSWETAVKRLSEHPDKLLRMAGIYREKEAAALEKAQALQADVII